MFLKSEKVKIVDGNTQEGMSKRTGNQYKLYLIYIEEQGIMTKLLVDERIMKKAQENKNKQATIVMYIDPNGKTTINDIQLV